MSDFSRKIIYTGVRIPNIVPDKRTGVNIFHHPTIRIKYDAHLDSAIVKQALEEECYLVFLSRNGVVGLNAWMQTTDISLDFRGKRIWAVGKQTAKEVDTTLGAVAGEPAEQNANGLIRVFETLKPRPVVLFCAEDPRPEYPDWLIRCGWQYNIFPVYRTVVVMNEDLAQRFSNTPDESIILTSPSTVKGFIESINMKDLSAVTARLFSIGPSTSKAIEAFGGKVYQEATEPDIDQLLTDIINEMDK
ncbi:MAG: uroporphyrinogen-III synthase [Candidatus Marinimicrobia bacterium]|nr:uroporphyrinogen-III synthase [Candidatus Neomarinimicrobiota bacterium]